MISFNHLFFYSLSREFLQLSSSFRILEIFKNLKIKWKKIRKNNNKFSLKWRIIEKKASILQTFICQQMAFQIRLYVVFTFKILFGSASQSFSVFYFCKIINWLKKQMSETFWMSFDLLCVVRVKIWKSWKNVHLFFKIFSLYFWCIKWFFLSCSSDMLGLALISLE